MKLQQNKGLGLNKMTFGGGKSCTGFFFGQKVAQNELFAFYNKSFFAGSYSDIKTEKYIKHVLTKLFFEGQKISKRVPE